ncbi:MAG: hypothetical protein ACK53Y_28020, partial [bacterium]
VRKQPAWRRPWRPSRPGGQSTAPPPHTRGWLLPSWMATSATCRRPLRFSRCGRTRPSSVRGQIPPRPTRPTSPDLRLASPSRL